MNVSDFKYDNTINSNFRKLIVMQTKREQLQKLQNGKIEIPPIIDIKYIIDFIIKTWKSKNIDDLKTSMRIARYYYSENIFEKNFEIIIENSEFLSSLLEMTQEGNIEIIREYAFEIILYLTCSSPQIASKLIQIGLLNMCTEVVQNVHGGINSFLGFKFVTKILASILSYSHIFYEEFKASPLPIILVQLLSNSAKIKCDIENDINDLSLKRIYEAEAQIICIFKLLYNFCGNSEDKVTRQILTNFVNLIENNHYHLISDICNCTTAMIISCPYARHCVTEVGLIQFMTTFLCDIQFEKVWIDLITTLHKAIEYSMNDEEQLTKLLKIIDIQRISNLFPYFVNYLEKDEIEMAMAKVFDIMSLILRLNPDSVKRLHSIESYIKLFDKDVFIYELKESGVSFFLHLANIGVPGLTETLFAVRGELIMDVLHNCPPKLTEFAISVLWKLAQSVIAAPDVETPVSFFFKTEDFQDLMVQWKESEFPEIQQIASNLYNELKSIISFDI